MNLQEQLSEERGKLVKEFADLIEKFQTETGLSIESFNYKRSSYCTDTRPHYVSITLKLDI